MKCKTTQNLNCRFSFFRSFAREVDTLNYAKPHNIYCTCYGIQKVGLDNLSKEPLRAREETEKPLPYRYSISPRQSQTIKDS